MAHVWSSEDHLQELVFCFHHVGSGNWTQVLRLRGHLMGPTVVLLLNKPHKARCNWLLPAPSSLCLGFLFHSGTV